MSFLKAWTLKFMRFTKFSMWLCTSFTSHPILVESHWKIILQLLSFLKKDHKWARVKLMKESCLVKYWLKFGCDGEKSRRVFNGWIKNFCLRKPLSGSFSVVGFIDSLFITSQYAFLMSGSFGFPNWIPLSLKLKKALEQERQAQQWVSYCELFIFMNSPLTWEF